MRWQPLVPFVQDAYGPPAATEEQLASIHQTLRSLEPDRAQRIKAEHAQDASPAQVGSMRIEDVVLPQVVNALAGLDDAALVVDDFIVSPAVRRANLWPG